MAPADIRKEGSSYDLPLAMGILAADEKVVRGEIESFILMESSLLTELYNRSRECCL